MPKRPQRIVTETKSQMWWMFTCRGTSEALWPVLIGRTRRDLLARGVAHFRVSAEYLTDRLRMKPVRVQVVPLPRKAAR